LSCGVVLANFRDLKTLRQMWLDMLVKTQYETRDIRGTKVENEWLQSAFGRLNTLSFRRECTQFRPVLFRGFSSRQLSLTEYS
jgi:hypothetical protein